MVEQYRVPVLEAFPWQEGVKSNTVLTPPSPSSKGDRYLVPKTVPRTSVWAGKENSIAWFDGFGWHYDTPLPGWVVYVEDRDVHLRWNSLEWIYNLSLPTISSDNITHTIYVDNSGLVDGDGSLDNPYRTIDEALQRILATIEPTAFVISISPGEYDEEISLENSKFNNVYFKGSGVDLTKINGIRSAENNDDIQYLYFDNLEFCSDIYLEGEINNTHFGTNFIFKNCRFSESCDIILYNLSTVSFKGDCEIEDDVSITNVSNVFFDRNCRIDGQLMEASFMIRCDLDQKKPANWPGLVNLYISCILQRFIDWQLHHNGTGYIQFRSGAAYGVKNNPFHIPAFTTYDVINSMLLGNFTYHGNLILSSSFVGGLLTKGTGTLDIQNQPASQIYNDSELEGATLAEVLNNLAGIIENLPTSGNDDLVYDQTLKVMLITPKQLIS